MNITLIAIIASLISIVAGILMIQNILKKSKGNEKMQDIANAIQSGAKAFLTRQYKTITYIAVPLFLILGFAINWHTAIAFIVGGLIIGASEKLAEIYIPPVMADLFGGNFGGIEGWFPYVMALLFLLVRPEGLFGEKHIETLFGLQGLHHKFCKTVLGHIRRLCADGIEKK